MVITGSNANTSHQGCGPPGVPQDQIDNIMSGISNTGTVKMNNHRKKLRQRFDIIKKLGQGTYGKVQLGINKETGQEVAIKTIKKCKIEAEADLVRIRREVQIMSSVQHPNIIHIYEVFENREKMVLVMEFAAGGELYDYLSERKVLAQEEARRIFRQVSTAVYYCHKHKICHRDLKLENILLDEHGNAKIADFGLSNVFDEKRLLSTFCGSPLYASPEIVKGTPYQGPEVDCWSLGVLLYTLVYGAMPFDGSNFKRLVKQISQGDYYEPKKPSPASPLIRDMLTVCPKNRATIEQICNHWWVNESYKGSCLELAEDLANQTPVRLDVLLSLSPAAVKADQLVVPSGNDHKTLENLPRSHSVGSIRDIVSTEAERRILDMVAAGGEQALMPSPTRTITPAESPNQIKRKLETTISTDNAACVAKKKEKPTESLINISSKDAILPMDTDKVISENATGDTKLSSLASDLPFIENTYQQLIAENPQQVKVDDQACTQKIQAKLDAVKESDELSSNISPTKVIKKFVNKHKTADLVAAVSKISPDNTNVSLERKSSLPEVSQSKNVQRRKSRILETAEKIQNAGSTTEKAKKIVIPGVSVGNFKKEFERRASLTNESNLTADRRSTEKKVEKTKNEQCNIEEKDKSQSPQEKVKSSDSKNSLASFSLEEARRSMENSIALLNQAKNENSKEVDQLCAKTENVSVSKNISDREKKLKNAREIIGNAIQPGGRLCKGVRKPPVPFGINGRSISGSVVSSTIPEKKTTRSQSISSPDQKSSTNMYYTPLEDNEVNEPQSPTKTSRAEITLKSATLPRRKTTKAEIQLEIKPKIPEQPMRFSTEMQHQVPDLRSTSIKQNIGSYNPYTPDKRSSSLEPQFKEHIISIQKPPSYNRSDSSSCRSGSLSRQSTNESDTDTTANNSQSTVTGSSQPIKKSPREFIIPIAVEGGGYITPRASSLEPSESGRITSSSAFSRLGKSRRLGSSLLKDVDSEEENSFQKQRNTPTGKDGEFGETRFPMHRLRSTRSGKKPSQDSNDSLSSGEDDDEDGFEILTAENLFSTLLQRVRALTNRLNVNNDISTDFSNSRLLGNIRQNHTPFWQQEPFARSQLRSSYKHDTFEKRQFRLDNNTSPAWRHSFQRDFGTDIDSMFSRSGATLPRGVRSKSVTSNFKPQKGEIFDLADLDLSKLRLNKKDLETLSNITPDLPKHFQEQLLAKLPPTQARKLSRTLSMQNNSACSKVNLFKRSLSGGRELDNTSDRNKKDNSKNAENAAYSQKNSSKYTPNSISQPRCSNLCSFSSGYKQSLCAPYISEINEKYKYYSPYSDKNVTKENFNSIKSNESTSPVSPSKEVYGRPPSGCFSIVTSTPENSLRRRPSQRRISRFLKPEYIDISREDNAYIRERQLRERETQNVLREIRERSRERSRDRKNTNYQSGDAKETITPARNSYQNIELLEPKSYIRNKSLEYYPESSCADLETVRLRQRSLPRSHNLSCESIDKKHSALTSKILDELFQLSNKKEESRLCFDENLCNDSENVKEKSTKKKRIKSKEHSQKRFELEENETNDTRLNFKQKSPSTANKDESSSCKQTIAIGKPKKESKLIRPKSYPYPNKQGESKSLSASNSNIVLKDMKQNSENNEKEKKSIVSKFSKATEFEKSQKTSNNCEKPKEITENSLNSKVVQKSNLQYQRNGSSRSSDSSSESKCIIRCNSKIPKKEQKYLEETPLNSSQEKNSIKNGNEKVQVPEKKQNKGLLYSIGQKFEKLRENAKMKEKNKICGKMNDDSNKNEKNITQENVDKTMCIKKNKHHGDSNTAINLDLYSNKISKTDKKSRLDSVIRSIRERSLPRLQNVTEAKLSKRAVSVEDISSSFPKRSVDKVLGLFKRSEKEDIKNNIVSTRSISNIAVGKKDNIGLNEISKTLIKNEATKQIGMIPVENINIPKGIASKERKKNKTILTDNKSIYPRKANEYSKQNFNCPDCIQETKTDNKNSAGQTFTLLNSLKNPIKEKRKKLVLDLTPSNSNNCKTNFSLNNNTLRPLTRLSCKNNNNNHSLYQEINQNHLHTPINDNITYYSSDSRSPLEECQSSSTFLSPSDEPELNFDSWSVCSEDNFVFSSSANISQNSRSSQYSSPSTNDNQTESVIDRIKRRSFYTRFNEKKPKRQSNIVRPAARDYYREAAAKLRARPPDRVPSPEINLVRNTHEHYKPMNTSISASIKISQSPSLIKSNYEDIKGQNLPNCVNYSKSKLRPYTTPISSSKKYSEIDHIKKNCLNLDLNSSLYRSYSPKRRSSFSPNGTASGILSYATLGRRKTSYDHRNMSLTEQTEPSSSLGALHRDQRASTELRNLSKPTLDTRRSSFSRCSTNT